MRRNFAHIICAILQNKWHITRRNTSTEIRLPAKKITLAEAKIPSRLSRILMSEWLIRGKGGRGRPFMLFLAYRAVLLYSTVHTI